MTTAAFLARTGRRVLVLEKHSTAGGATQTFRRAGYEWDAGKLEWAPMPDVYNRVFIADREYEYRSGVRQFKDRMKEYFPLESGAIDRYVDMVHTANRTARPYLAPPSALHRRTSRSTSASANPVTGSTWIRPTSGPTPDPTSTARQPRSRRTPSTTPCRRTSSPSRP
ncbi:NAD(P)-binding protein [Streptomyces sp. NBC_00076]|uniref:NAD(P)-binding protein n=1 Tax=Streptomyces sp. NBC_00076 TaxID=2975642 RepID=UPI0032565FF0